MKNYLATRRLWSAETDNTLRDLRNSRLHKICLSRGQGWWRLWWRFDKICGTSQICGNLSKKRLKSIELTKLDGRVRECARKVILFLWYIQCFIVFFYMFRVPITFVSLRNRFLVILFFILVYFIYCIVVSLLFFSPTNRTLYCKCIFPFPILITS